MKPLASIINIYTDINCKNNSYILNNNTNNNSDNIT